MIRIFILTILLGSLLQGKSPLPNLTKADGSIIMTKPIGLDGDKIIFLKEDGKQVSVALNFFSAAEQKKLIAWRSAVKKNNHQQVVSKMKSDEQAKVLFIGNSYNFNVPNAFEKLAQSKGKKILVDQVAKADWTVSHSPSTPKSPS